MTAPMNPKKSEGILNGKIKLNKVGKFILRMSFMSPERVLALSEGEVKNPRFNYRDKPADDGLMCEKIFGPVKNLQCRCGRLNKRKDRFKTCPECGVKVFDIKRDRPRSKRVGHIEIPIPIVHPLTTKYVPHSKDRGEIVITGRPALEQIFPACSSKYMADYTSGIKWVESDDGPYILNDGRRVAYEEVQLLPTKLKDYLLAERSSNKGVLDLEEGENANFVDTSALTVGEAILEIDFNESAFINHSVFHLLANGVNPHHYVLRRILVSPANHRPYLELENGTKALWDSNHLYRRLLTHTTRIKRMQEDYDRHKSVDTKVYRLMLLSEYVLLQRAMNRLFLDGAEFRKQPVKPLIESLKGKSGRLRSSILGKTVDFSGRTVIVTDPSLPCTHASIPIKIMTELLKPEIIGVIAEEDCRDFRHASFVFSNNKDRVYKVLESIVKDHVILLNRAPTLFRYGIQAFQISLTRNNAIGIPPMVCKGFNADHDGDQMAIHLVLQKRAREEVKQRATPINNLLSSVNSQPMVKPAQDMIIGAYYMTKMVNSDNPKVLSSYEQGLQYLDMGLIKINEEIRIRNRTTTIGREILGQLLKTEIDEALTSKSITAIISRYFDTASPEQTGKMLDTLKDVTYEWATRSGTSICIDDIVIPSGKDQILEEVDKKKKEVESRIIGNDEFKAKIRSEQVIMAQSEAVGKLRDQVVEESTEDNNLMVMLRSGARANMIQVQQLGTCIGLKRRHGAADPEFVKGNFREGLSIDDYIKLGGRRSLYDKADLTPKSGYLTRRLIYLLRELHITEYDCGTTNGILLDENLTGGRFTTKGELIAGIPSGVGMTRDMKNRTFVRSPITCESKSGLCVKCYGVDPTTRRVADLYTSAGIMAAGALSEPTTQMSADYDERVIVCDLTEGARIRKIGEFVDSLLEECGAVQDGGWELANLSGNLLIQSMDPIGNVRWSPIKQVSRHPAPSERLVKITTRSGRKVVTTACHSHYKRENGKIVQVAGRDLKLDDRIPVIFNSTLPPGVIDQIKVQSPNGPDRNTKYFMPEFVKLDEDLGYLIGRYLADGSVTRYWTSFNKAWDPNILARTQKSLAKLGFKSRIVKSKASRGVACVTNSVQLGEFIESTCGKGAYNKHVPDFAFCAPDQFVRGILAGFFDGDAYISRNNPGDTGIRFFSVSEDLIVGLNFLLSRFGIYATRKRDNRELWCGQIITKYVPRFRDNVRLEDATRQRNLELRADNADSLRLSEYIDKIGGWGEILTGLAKKYKQPKQWWYRKEYGRTTLEKKIKILENAGATEEELRPIFDAVNSDVLWDKIVKIECVESTGKYVYDISVPSDESFSTAENIVIHNTMRTFHTGGVVDIRTSPLTVNSSIGGKVKVEEGEYTNSVTVENQSESRRYFCHSNYSIILVKNGQTIESGDSVISYSQDIQSNVGDTLKLLMQRLLLSKNAVLGLISKHDGIVELKPDKGKIRIMVGGRDQGYTDTLPVYFGDGDFVNAGTHITYGIPNIKDLFRHDISLAGSVFVHDLLQVYKSEGISSWPVHAELIFRGMTNLVRVYLGEGVYQYGMRHLGDKGKTLLCALDRANLEVPSWLKSLSYENPIYTLQQVGTQAMVNRDLPVERIMMGRLLHDVG